jgi:hypothetical protein
MKITAGKIPGAQKIVIYGPEGIGKSTFAAGFPGALFIDTEGSTKHLDVRRLDAPSSWSMLLEEVRFVAQNPSVCSTLVIDTVDWAEQLCITHICAKAQKTGIEDFGYGKGYTYLAEEFGRLLNLLTEVVDAGINVVATAHSQIRKFELPDEATAYDRWELKLQKKTAPLVKEWADMVLFANYKTFVVKTEDGKGKANGGQRVIHTAHRPTWDAKNRHGLPDEIEFSYGAIAGVLEATNAPLPSIDEALAQSKDKGGELVQCDPHTPEAVLSHDSEAAGLTGADAKAAGAQAAPGAVPAHLDALYQLMAKDDVTDVDVRRAVASKGYYPRAMAIDKYDPQFVTGNLVGAWPQVLDVIKQTADEDIPF